MRTWRFGGDLDKDLLLLGLVGESTESPLPSLVPEIYRIILVSIGGFDGDILLVKSLSASLIS